MLYPIGFLDLGIKKIKLLLNINLVDGKTGKSGHFTCQFLLAEPNEKVEGKGGKTVA